MKRYTVTNPTDARFKQLGELDMALDNGLVLKFPDGTRCAYPQEHLTPLQPAQDAFHQTVVGFEPPITPELLRLASVRSHNIVSRLSQIADNIAALNLDNALTGAVLQSQEFTITHKAVRMLRVQIGLVLALKEFIRRPVAGSLTHLRYNLTLAYDVLGTTDADVCEQTIDDLMPPPLPPVQHPFHELLNDEAPSDSVPTQQDDAVATEPDRLSGEPGFIVGPCSIETHLRDGSPD